MPVARGYVAEKYPINQKILNAMIRNRLQNNGWKVKGVKLAPKEHGLQIRQNGDFSKTLENEAFASFSIIVFVRILEKNNLKLKV